MSFNDNDSNNFSNSYINNSRLGDESGDSKSNEQKRYFLELSLKITTLEVFASSLSLLSSIFYLKASLVGQQIILSELNGINSGLDSTPYVNVGETLGLIVLFIFTYSAFLRYNEKSLEDPQHKNSYRKIALSYIPSLLAYMTRINARREILNNLPNI